MSYKQKLILCCLVAIIFAIGSGIAIVILQFPPGVSILLGLAAGLICMIFLLLTVSRLLRPLKYLEQVSRRYLDGDRSMRLETLSSKGNDELAATLLAFNTALRENRHVCAEAEQMQQIFGTISTMLDDVLFVYDLQNDTITFSNDWNIKNPASELFEIMRRDHALHPDDEAAFFRFFDQLRKGAPGVSLEVRMIVDGHEDYTWSRLWGATLLSDDGVPRKIIGRRINIDRERRERQSLEEKAQRDAMTRLYNATAFASQSTHMLQTCQGGALFVIDVDNFKALNDGMGHLFGNAVLTQVSARLQEEFPVRTVIGRVGGDEFAMYSASADSDEDVADIAERILEIFRQGVISTGAAGQWKISGSIGAARRTAALTGGYDELFQMADDAMYRAKTEGKNCWRLYTEELKGYHTRYAGRKETATREEGIQVSLTDNLAEYIFNILYETPEIDAAVQLILEIVGRHYSVSRAYVFENQPDNEHCKNTFEWCAAGVLPMIGDLNSICYRDFDQDYRSNFDESGIFYCADVSSLPSYTKEFLGNQSICSLLQAAILSDGEFRGLVGFDECTGNRVWTTDEVATLSFVAKVLSVFLLRRTAEQRERIVADSLKTILDNQEMLSYVVDVETYELQFFNRNTRRLVSNLKIGEYCYEKFMARNTPCEFCLVPKLSIEQPSAEAEIYNPHLKVWVQTTASLIPWMDGKIRCLLCCNDITRYKNME